MKHLSEWLAAAFTVDFFYAVIGGITDLGNLLWALVIIYALLRAGYGLGSTIHKDDENVEEFVNPFLQ